ncbi:MAG: hypothetical protein WCV82_03790 [Candidatus Paceibacterota bacterium]|jgi:hypothetical protein
MIISSLLLLLILFAILVQLAPIPGPWGRLIVWGILALLAWVSLFSKVLALH